MGDQGDLSLLSHPRGWEALEVNHSKNALMNQHLASDGLTGKLDPVRRIAAFDFMLMTFNNSCMFEASLALIK